MSRNSKGPTGRAAIEEMEERLGEVFGTLGGALKGVLEAAKSAEQDGGGTERTFDFSSGPIRAQSSMRIRVGGVDLGESTRAPDRDITKPVNPDTAKPSAAESHASRPTAREPLFDTYLENGAWMLTAEIPGIPEDAVQITVKGRSLELMANGHQTYRTVVEIPEGLDPASLQHTVTNGILELRGQIDQGGADL